MFILANEAEMWLVRLWLDNFVRNLKARSDRESKVDEPSLRVCCLLSRGQELRTNGEDLI